MANSLEDQRCGASEVPSRCAQGPSRPVAHARRSLSLRVSGCQHEAASRRRHAAATVKALTCDCYKTEKDIEAASKRGMLQNGVNIREYVDCIPIAHNWS